MTTQIINIFLGVFSWGVAAAYVQRPVQEMYNSDYISFLIAGVAIGNLVLPIAQGVERQLNPWTMETVLMTGIERTVTVTTDRRFVDTFENVRRFPAEHYLKPEARLMELAIRDTRERMARNEGF